MNKASGGDGIPPELLKILKMMLLKCCTQCVSKFGKLSSGHKTGKKSVFISNLKEWQCQRMFKLSYSCAHFPCQQGYTQNLSSQASAVQELRTSRCTNWVQEKQRNQRSNCQHLLHHRESKGIPEKHLLLCIDYTKAFDSVDHNKLWKILKVMAVPD